MSKLLPTLHLVHLYPKEMNIYGDTGNRIVLEKRLQWRGIPFVTHLVSIGDEIPKDADIIIGGGGQDASQNTVALDLQSKKHELTRLASNGCVMLMVCGMYQLFGRRFVTSEGEELTGIGILPVETLAKSGRLIGNIHAMADTVGKVVGYENHSGRTYLDNGAQPFAKVLLGCGNDDDSGCEGCRLENVFGTYMHGPILSKNPVLADELVRLAFKRRGYVQDLELVDDQLIESAHHHALKRPR